MAHNLLFLCTGPDFEPSLWMWANPNILFSPGKQEAPESGRGKDLTSILPSPQLPPKEEDFVNYTEATVMELLPPSFSEQSSPQKRFTSSPSSWEVGISGVMGQIWGRQDGHSDDTSEGFVFLGVTKG